MYKRKKGIDSKNSFLKITNGKGRICQRNMQATPGNVDRVSSLHELDNDGATMNVENTITQVNDVTNYNAPPLFFFFTDPCATTSRRNQPPYINGTDKDKKICKPTNIPNN